MNPHATTEHRRLLTDQRGLALVAVLLLTTMMLALGIFGTRNARIELQIAGNDVLGKQALAVAEAGIQHAASLIDAAGGPSGVFLSNGGTGGLAGLGTVTTLDGASYRFRPFGAGANDGYYVRVVDNYDEPAGNNDPATDTDRAMKIISRGRVGAAERVIERLLTKPSIFQWPMFGKNRVLMGGNGGFTDSYNSYAGDYSAAPHGSRGSLRSNGDVMLTAAIIVNGDATAGGVVNPGSNGVITGTVTNSAPPVTLDPVPACGPPYSGGAGISGTYTYFPNGDKAGQLIVGGGDNATLAPGTYCFSDVTFSGGATLTVNGPVKIYLTGQGKFGGGGIANTTHKPVNLQIFSSYTGEKQGLTINGGSDAFAVVYAPQTEVVLGGGADFFGSLIAGQIESTGGSKIHYDEALAGYTGDTRAGWREVRNLW